jgi:hypothetical protein
MRYLLAALILIFSIGQPMKYLRLTWQAFRWLLKLTEIASFSRPEC